MGKIMNFFRPDIRMSPRVSDPLEGLDFKKEYVLIKEKKSKLSATQRARITRRCENQLVKTLKEVSEKIVG